MREAAAPLQIVVRENPDISWESARITPALQKLVSIAVRINMKKAQGLPLNTIIIAILALIVLFVLIMIFTGKISFFGKQSTSCASGICANSPDCGDGLIGYQIEGCSKDSRGPFCCPSPLTKP